MLPTARPSMLALLAAAPLLVAATLPEPAQDEALDGAAILDRTYAALGPPEVLAAVKNRLLQGKGGFAGTGNEGTFEELIGGIDLARIQTSIPGFGEGAEGAGYGVVWERNPMVGANVKGAEAAVTSLRRYGLLAYAPWRELYEAALLRGEEQISLGGETDETVTVHVLALTPRRLTLEERADGSTGVIAASAEHGDDELEPLAPDIWYVDQDSHLPVRIDVVMMDPRGGVAPVEIVQTDWREVDGIRYPFEKRVTTMGFTWVQRYESIQHDVDLPANAFHVPQDVREKMGATLSDEQPDAAAIRVEEIEERHAATIRVSCEHAEIGDTLAVALPEIMIHLTSVGARVNGAPFTRYHSFGPEGVDLEAGIPVAEPIEPSGRIQAATLPGGHAVTAWHVGPYEELSRTHNRVEAWIEEHGIEVTGPLWEIYWTDPGMEPDPKKWRTQILVPCVAPKD